MPEMSADVEHPDLTVAAVGSPTAPALPSRATAAAPSTGSPETSSANAPAEPAAASDVDVTPRWRLTAMGYAILTAGFTLAVSIPHMPLRAGLLEDALIILGIVTMLTGAAVVVASFVLNLLRPL